MKKYLHSSHHNMRFIHWILFIIAFWVIIAPFVGDDIIRIFVGEDIYSQLDIVKLMRWDDLFLGIGICILALLSTTFEQLSKKRPGLKAMHWIQLVLGLWIAAAPFGFDFDMTAFMWSHFVSGIFVAVFALIQITYEE